MKKKLYRFGKKSFIFTLLDLTTFYISLNDSNDIKFVKYFLNCLLLGLGGAVAEDPGHH